MTAPRVVGGRYELGELLGYGGMAEVHRGRDLRLGRDVAVKVLRADLSRDPSFQNRFRREAQAAAGLNHPSIVAVYDTGEGDGSEGSQPYIVMEYVEGRTLREILKSEGRLPPKRAVEITAEVCAALDFSHRSGIVHRDIKPGNVMITSTGAVKVMDFGIARAMADDAATMTATSAVIGTAQYLSPEQARGEAVDARSDVYSVGCLLYELLVGHPPFNGDSPVAVVYQHVRETPQPPSTVNGVVSPALDSIVMKALAKNPLNRYQNAAEMRQDLQRAIAGQPVEAEAVLTDADRTQFIGTGGAAAGTPTDGARPIGYDDEDDHRPRHTAAIWTAVVAALVVVIGVGAFLILRNNSDDKSPTMYTVPSLVGLNPDVARDAIREGNHFVVANGTPEQVNGPCSSGSSSAPDTQPPAVGTVCTQSPQAGSNAEAGTPVSFTVYAGPANVTVPEVRGSNYEDAADVLRKSNLVPQRVDVNDSHTAGQVINQDPPAGASVKPGAPIRLTVANGKVKLPDVTKLTEQAARAKLNELGFTQIPSQPATVREGFEPGQVMAMSPTPGIFYDPTTTITLTIAQPLPPCGPDESSSSPAGSASATATATATATSSATATANPTCTP